MKNQEIFDFITSNTVGNLKEYNKRLIDKLDGISDKMNRVSLWMILCVIVYFLFSASMISSVDVGFMTLTKLDIIPMFIPFLFSLIILYFLVLNNHYYELLQASKIISYAIYTNPNLDVFDFTTGYNNDYVRLAQPFSPWIEVQKWHGKGQYGKIERLLTIPLLLFLIFPPAFEFLMVERLFTKYWNYGFAKWSAGFSIWISVFCIFWVIRAARVAVADFKAGILPPQPAQGQPADNVNVQTVTDTPPAPENI